ncbi:MAG: hypothetical protein JWN45_1920, partial [Acidobacteriaceae bacterium]|nr:hypothetical protein [Acidobacteriaceae bacterium]
MPRNFFAPLRRYLTGFQAESFFTHSTNILLLLLLVTATVVPATAQSTHHKKSNSKPKIQGGTSRQARPFNRHAIDALEKKGGEASRAETGGPEQEQYDNRALPNTAIASAQQQNAYLAFQSVAKLPGGKKTNWQELGPITPVVPGPSNYTGRTTTDSGRVTALAVSPICVVGNCKIFTGAAGGGVWEADNALDPQPNWHSSSSGLTSNAIGSLIFDPTDSLGKTLYAGTGEPNGSGDSEAGVGLFKSVDYGKSWTLVSGSVAAAKDRSIGAIAVDPVNSNHIFIGTAVARHGSSSVNGGRFTPPGAPTIGLYESTDGGATFSLVFSRASDTVAVGTPTGNDFFRGGISKILFDRTGLS